MHVFGFLGKGMIPYATEVRAESTMCLRSCIVGLRNEVGTILCPQTTRMTVRLHRSAACLLHGGKVSHCFQAHDVGPPFQREGGQAISTSV